MIRRLQKKFVAAAIVAVFLVLLVLIGSINVLSYRSLVSDADSTLQILADNKGAFPRQMFRMEDKPPEMPTQAYRKPRKVPSSLWQLRNTSMTSPSQTARQ